MKNVLTLALSLTAIPAFACVQMSGEYVAKRYQQTAHGLEVATNEGTLSSAAFLQIKTSTQCDYTLKFQQQNGESSTLKYAARDISLVGHTYSYAVGVIENPLSIQLIEKVESRYKILNDRAVQVETTHSYYKRNSFFPYKSVKTQDVFLKN